MPKIIAVDFDGTLCTNEWPYAGEPNIVMIRYLQRAQANGDKLILWTCRTRKNLKFAINWCKEQGLVFDAVNKNLKESIKRFGGDSRKIYADVYLDDKVSPWWGISKNEILKGDKE